MKYITFILVCMPLFQYAQSSLWRYLDGNIYYPSGKVGIGIATPTERFAVAGNIKSHGLMTEGIVIGSQTAELAYPFAKETIGVGSPAFNLRLQSPNNIYFHTRIGMEEDSAAIDKVRMSILGNGNVGIGTLNPTQQLSITANNQFAQLKLERTGSRVGATYLGGSELGFTVGHIDSAQYVIDFTSAPNGNVGIGTTDPIVKLDVNGDIRLGDVPRGGNKLYLTNIQSHHFIRANDWWTEFVSNPNEGWLFKATPEEEAKVMIRARDGFMGIGTITPKEKLEINGNLGFNGANKYINFYEGNTRKAYLRYSGTHLNMINDEADGDVYLSAKDDVILNGKNDIDITASDDIWFKTGGDTRMRVTSVGNVGISTTTPDVNFQVNHGSGWQTKGLGIQRAERSDLRWHMYVFDSGNLSFVEDNREVRRTLQEDGDWLKGSDKKLKKGVKTLSQKELEKLMQVRSTTYQYRDQKDEELQYGFIAQELQEVYPDLVSEVKEDDFNQLMVSYEEFIPLLVGFTQQQQKELNQQQDKIAALEQENTAIRQELKEIKQLIYQLNDQQTFTTKSVITDKLAHLFQHHPNPFSQSTTIQFFVPETIKEGVLRITNINGQVIRQISLKTRGKGKVELEASTLSAGNYWYSLILDNKVIDTKQMILTED
ncbi:MAG: tail fiber domain-containing protein [Bacteroidota bacterium]